MGPAGRDGQDADPLEVAEVLVSDSSKRSTISNDLAENSKFQSDVKSLLNQDGGFQKNVRNLLKSDQGFQDSVKGEAGKDGKSPAPNVVAEELVTTKANKLGQAVLEAKDAQSREILVNNPILQEGIAERLRENPGNTQGPQGDKGDPGDVSAIIDSLKQQRFTLKKGEKLSEDIYEANIALNDKTIATLPKIGYYLLNDQLIIRNHVTKEEVAIPRDFHYLKVVKFGSGFGSDDYKLTFCNVLGNGFFEYKKYDLQYSNISDEYKFISLNYVKKEYNPNLSELFHPWPLFFITEGPAEPDSGKYSAAVFELTQYGKGKKMATLIDEFGYFDKDDEFMYYNYHEGMDSRSYDPTEINKEYGVTDAESAFYLAGNITLHTIPEL